MYQGLAVDKLCKIRYSKYICFYKKNWGLKRRKGMKRRIVSALLAAVMVMDMASVPVAATATSSVVSEASALSESIETVEVQDTESASESVEKSEAETAETSSTEESEGSEEKKIISLEASENSYAYATTENGEKQFVVTVKELQEKQQYTVEITDADEQCTVKEAAADASHSLQIPFAWKQNSTYEIMVVDGATAYSCKIDTADMTSDAGVLKTYADGDVKAENLTQTDAEGQVLLAYGDEKEKDLLTVVDTKGQDSSGLDVNVDIDHVTAVPYTLENDTYVYGVSTQLRPVVVSDTDTTPVGTEGSEASQTQETSAVSEAIVPNGTTDENGIATQTVNPAPAPGTVDWLNVESLDGMVNLSWGAAANATEYDIYYYTWTNKANVIYAGSTAQTTYTVSNLENGKGYTFHVVPKNTTNGYPVYSSVDPATSWRSSTKLTFVKPSAVSSFNVTQSDAGNQLTWTYNGGRLTGYILYYYDYNAGCYRRLATVDASATSYTQTGVKKGDRYKYAIRPYRMEKGVYYGADMTEKIVYGQSFVDETLDAVHPMFYTAYTKKRVGMFQKKNQKDSKDYIRVLKKGTKVTVIMNDPFKPKIKLEDGTVGYTWRGAIRLAVEHYTSKDYTDLQKEAFVNSKGYSSKTGYLIWIATYTQKVYVFKGSQKKWKLIRTCPAATGAIDSPDYPGEEKIVGKRRWHRYGKRFYQYLSVMSDGNTIHTRPSWKSNGKPVDARLGRPLSHGCVRVTDSDGAYIYNNCGKNTKVLIY